MIKVHFASLCETCEQTMTFQFIRKIILVRSRWQIAFGSDSRCKHTIHEIIKQLLKNPGSFNFKIFAKIKINLKNQEKNSRFPFIYKKNPVVVIAKKYSRRSKFEASGGKVLFPEYQFLFSSSFSHLQNGNFFTLSRFNMNI